MAKNKYPLKKEFQKYTHIHLSLEEKNVLRLQRSLEKAYDKAESDEEIQVDKYQTKSFDGERIRMVLYTPVELLMEEKAPLLIYYHGGGFVLPAMFYHFRLAKTYAKQAPCKVLFVEYRLAPTYQFPTAPEDGYTAYAWVRRHANRLGIDVDRIAVAGDSAGGEIATVVCLMAHDRDLPLPCGQMLLYPACSKGYKTESMDLYTDTPMCNSKHVEIYEKYYVGDIEAGKWEYISPIDSDALDTMPASYVETAEFDCLRDAAILYAEKMQGLGVDVTLRNTKGTMHAYDIEKSGETVAESIAARVAFLKKVFGMEVVEELKEFIIQ